MYVIVKTVAKPDFFTKMREKGAGGRLRAAVMRQDFFSLFLGGGGQLSETHSFGEGVLVLFQDHYPPGLKKT